MPDIRIQRLELGLTQREVATIVGTYQHTVWRAETHPDREPKWLPRIAKALARITYERECEKKEIVAIHQRISEQRELWSSIPDSFGKAAAEQSMLYRCLELMRQGRGEECDAIAEWLPADKVEAMFKQWDAEQIADRKCAVCSPAELHPPG